MSATWLVAKWEFQRAFKWKQELAGYAFLLVIYAGIFAVQMWQQYSTQKQFNLGVVGQLLVELKQPYRLETLAAATDQQHYYQYLEDKQLDGILLVSAPNNYQLFVGAEAGWQTELADTLAAQHKQQLLLQLNLSHDDLSKLENPVDFTVQNQYQDKRGSGVRALSIGVAVLASLAVFSAFALCLQSVTVEKQQRVTEQLLTCISYQQWVDGKTLGLFLYSIKSLVTTALYMGLAVLAMQVFGSGDGLDIVFSPGLFALLLVYLLLGILMWNYFYVGFASTIDDPNHSGKTGAMMLPMLPIFLVFMLMSEPGGQVAVVLSVLPLTSVSFMPMRLASMDVPALQVVLSLLCLLGMMALMRVVAMRLFRANISLYGKEPGWMDIWRSMLKK